MSVTIAGGVGGLDHYFSNGTVVENLAGTAFTGSAHGYRVTMRASGDAALTRGLHSTGARRPNQSIRPQNT